MPKLTINGKAVEVTPGTTILQAALANGIFVPHYCYHPGLTLAGNCRMCLVKVSTSRKLEASCMIRCAEGMTVETEAPEVKEARKNVLEFMLANHPLDCPICDKAGECDLQDFTRAYRGGLSRFHEDKVIRHTKDLGPTIKIWGNRCISCTRCVRFCNEITGSGELTIVERGDHSVVDTFPGIPLDNKMSLNTVDICPVGALIGKDFLYQARVWFMDRTESVCPSCGRGCNVTVSSLKGEVKRLEPRENEKINQYWMCDDGRLNYRYINAPDRLRAVKGALTIENAAQAIVKAVEQFSPARFAMVVSTWQTLEELYLFKKLSGYLGASAIGVVTLERGERAKFKGGFEISADKTPNRKGAEIVFGDGPTLNGFGKIPEGVRKGEIKAALVVNAIPDETVRQNLADALQGIEFLAVVDIAKSPLTEMARIAIPAATFIEKDGTYVNEMGIRQRIRKGIDPPGDAAAESDILQRILVAAGEREVVLSAEGVLRESGIGS